MKQHTIHLKLRTDGRGLIDFTALVESWLAGRSVITGVLTVFCVHTSASLLIQENAAPEVRSEPVDPGGGRPAWVGNLASDLSVRTSSPTA